MLLLLFAAIPSSPDTPSFPNGITPVRRRRRKYG